MQLNIFWARATASLHCLYFILVSSYVACCPDVPP